MRRLVEWGVRLYPAQWRARYGDEFLALIEDAPPRWRDVWDVLRGALAMQLTSGSFIKMVAAFAIAGMLAAAIWSAMLPDRYVSTSVLRLAQEADLRTTQQQLLQAQQKALSRSSLSNIIMRQNLYQDDRAKYPLEDIIQRMRNQGIRIQAVQYDKGAMFAVSFSYTDRAAAQKTVRELVAALNGAAPMEVVDPASDPTEPAGPNRLGVVARGLLAGLLVGLLCAGLWSLVRRGEPWSFQRVGAFAVAGMILGVTVAVLVPNQYISTAVLRAPDKSAAPEAIERALAPQALANIVRKYGLYQRDVAHGSVESAAEKMQKDIRVQAIQPVNRVGLAGAFTISFHCADGAIAQHVTGDLVTEIMKQYGGGNAVEVLDPASFPRVPSSPNRVTIIAFGMLCGLLLGLVSTCFRRPAPAAA